MKRYRITRIVVPAYPVVRLTFEDGLTGEIDVSHEIETAESFAALKNEEIFRSVAITEDGLAFGWCLADPDAAIGICADSARTDVETALVRQRAERFRARLSEAAE
jgi:hypothetical protein